MSKTRMLIIGASGFLGQVIARQAASVFDVFEADITPPPGEHGLAMDITAAESVRAGFERTVPDVAILLAAISDIDECERRPDLARAVNVQGAATVADACARHNTRLVFTSSAAVFDGTQHGYTESDPPSPVSVYGSTKAQAEDLLRRTLPSSLILRMALVVGLAQGSGTNAMLNKFSAKLGAGESVSFPDYEFRNPIDAGTLSCFLLELLRLGAAGLYHVGASESISRFELGVTLAERMGFSPHLVKPETAPLPGRAPRGPDHFLRTDKLRAACGTPVPTCSEVIERAIHGSTESNS